MIYLMIIGNWKMYKTGKEAAEFIRVLVSLIKDTSAQAFLAVPFTALEASVHAAAGSKVVIGAQNMHDAEEGAFTGEISATMLRSIGAQFVILGHSERRELFKESDAFINRKVKSALKMGLKPILCIGETAQQRESNHIAAVLQAQLKNSLDGLSENELKEVVVAYEPIWAIGTGKTATPEIAQETHRLIRHYLPKTIPILYGGSVKPENSVSLLAQPDINGALVGGASLNVESFAKIVTLNVGL